MVVFPGAIEHRPGVAHLIDEARRKARGRRARAGAAAIAVTAVAVGTFFFLHGRGGPALPKRSAQGGAGSQAVRIRDRFVSFGELPKGSPRFRIPADVRAASRIVGRLEGATIFAAPTRDGYWEMFAVGKGGWAGGRPWRAIKTSRPSAAFLVGGGGTSSSHAYLVVSGSALVAPGAKLFVVYADGSRERIKVIWVSKPIRAGFYYHVIAKAHRIRARRATALELIRGSRVIARQTLVLPRRLPLPSLGRHP